MFASANIYEITKLKLKLKPCYTPNILHKGDTF